MQDLRPGRLAGAARSGLGDGARDQGGIVGLDHPVAADGVDLREAEAGRVLAGAALQDVRAAPAVEDIVAHLTAQAVVARVAVEDVTGFPCVNRVRLDTHALAVERITAVPADEEVAARVAAQDVVRAAARGVLDARLGQARRAARVLCVVREIDRYRRGRIDQLGQGVGDDVLPVTAGHVDAAAAQHEDVVVRQDLARGVDGHFGAADHVHHGTVAPAGDKRGVVAEAKQDLPAERAEGFDDVVAGTEGQDLPGHVARRHMIVSRAGRDEEGGGDHPVIVIAEQDPLESPRLRGDRALQFGIRKRPVPATELAVHVEPPARVGHLRQVERVEPDPALIAFVPAEVSVRGDDGVRAGAGLDDLAPGADGKGVVARCPGHRDGRVRILQHGVEPVALRAADDRLDTGKAVRDGRREAVEARHRAVGGVHGDPARKRGQGLPRRTGPRRRARLPRSRRRGARAAPRRGRSARARP